MSNLKIKIEGVVREHFGLTKNQIIKDAQISYREDEDNITIIGTMRVEAPLSIGPAGTAGSGLKERMKHVANTTPAHKAQRTKTSKVKDESTNDEIIPGGSTSNSMSDITDNEVRRFIKALQQRKWLKRLNENQIAAYDGLKGNKISDLTDQQREQYKDLYEQTGSKN